MANPFHLDWCSYPAVVYACKHWHYSKSVPVGKLVKIGAWENQQFIGCIVFGRGANYNIGRPYGLKQYEVCELVRIALGKHMTPTSQLVSKSIRMLKRKCPRMRLVISYADVNQAHTGILYQATNWIYEGYRPVTPRIWIHGKATHARSISKKYGTASLSWLQAHIDPQAKKMKDLGRHKYLMPLDRKMRRQLLLLSKPYPKREK